MAALPYSRALTVDDLAALPDDGHRYELLDGSLVVTPAPHGRHQIAVIRLLHAFAAAATEGPRYERAGQAAPCGYMGRSSVGDAAVTHRSRS